ncbi:hypothetical protein [Nocardia niwae]|uniref:hypothetical protein n=1 Tax=Nocardia niwae TaxID=626084 RepID=UPI0012F4B5E8|nr:hypothetical protein [Nocardia niwae]
MYIVASVRLTIWGTAPRSRLFTLALLALAASYTLALATIGDRRIDPALTGVMGENISDLAHTVLLTFACYLYGLVFVRVLVARGWRRVWSVYGFVTVTALVVTSRFGDAARLPVDDEFELQDGWTSAYSAIFLTFLAVTCLLIFAGTAKVFRASRKNDRRAFIALVFAGGIGVVYAVVAAVWLLCNSHVLRDNHGIIITLAAVPMLTGLSIAGLYGVVDAWMAKRRVN